MCVDCAMGPLQCSGAMGCSICMNIKSCGPCIECRTEDRHRKESLEAHDIDNRSTTRHPLTNNTKKGSICNPRSLRTLQQCGPDQLSRALPMSNLSNLLNPSTSTSQSPQPTRPEPLNMTTNNGAQQRRRESITSPGLDALAAAASMSYTAPLLSPTNSTTFNQGSGFQRLPNGAPSQIYSSPSSFPRSTFSPGLAQYHHPTNGERRPSSSSDRPTLAPYQPIAPQEYALNTRGADVEMGNSDINGTEGKDSAQCQAVTPHDALKAEATSDATATTQIREPLAGPQEDLPAIALPEGQSEQVLVKTEMGDVPIPDAQGAVDGFLGSYAQNVSELLHSIHRTLTFLVTGATPAQKGSQYRCISLATTRGSGQGIAKAESSPKEKEATEKGHGKLRKTTHEETQTR